MNTNRSIPVHDWDKDTSREELLTRLARLKCRVRDGLPILDDDDLEAAIEEAAHRLAHD